MTNFNFMGKAKLFGLVSFALFAGSIVSLVVLGLQPGIDFTGGIQLALLYPPGTKVDLGSVRAQVNQVLAEAGAGASVYLQHISAERELAQAGPRWMVS